MAIIDVVRFNGLRNRDWIVYKYPSDKLVWGTQLIVQEGQAAIFMSKGVACDVFAPGKYTIKTQNLPILDSIVNIPFGGKTPFSAEIYFLNTATKMDINWGTTNPIQLIDPKYYVKLRVRAFGQMAMKLYDPSKFFKELIGGMGHNEIVRYDKIKEFYRGILVTKVKSIVAEIMMEDKLSALEISPKLMELSDTVKGKLDDEFSRYGLTIINFNIQSINFPDEDFESINRILEDKAAFEIMGDTRYVTKRAFDVYEGAANNENGVAGAFAAGGVGLGAGVGMASAMSTSIGNPIAQPNVQQHKKCPICNTECVISAKFCPECGYDYTKLVCSCGHKLEPGAKFCPECGKKVE